MTDPDLTARDLTAQLERSGARTPVGPPPLGAMQRNVFRRRRRRGWVVSTACAAAVATIAVGATYLAPAHLGADVAGPDAPPPGVRFVGVGSVAIAVPAEWGMDEIACGIPQRDTVITLDPARFGSATCVIPAYPSVESVQVGQGPILDEFTPTERIEIGGAPAERTETVCTDADIPGDAQVYCSATLRMLDQDLWFRVRSPIGAEEVEGFLDTIQIRPDQVGVPLYRHLNSYEATTSAGEAYGQLLTEAGLKVEFTRSQERVVPTPPAGYIVEVSPAPSTRLPPGSTVTVSITGE